MVVPAPRLRSVLVLLVSAISFAFGASAQEAAPPPPPTPSVLERLLVEVIKQDEDLQKKFAETRTVIEGEIAAKRIDAGAAQNILWALRANNIAGMVDIGPVVTSAGALPARNEAINDAVQKLEVTWKKIQEDRNILGREAIAEAGRRTKELARTAEKPTEIDPLLAQLETITNALSARSQNATYFFPGRTMSSIRGCSAFLRNFQALLSARENGDPKTIGVALSRIHVNTGITSGESAITEGDIDQFVHQFQKPFLEATQAAQANLDKLLMARRPANELSTVLAKFEDAVGKLQAEVYGTRMNPEWSNPLNTYRGFVDLARAMEKQDFPSARKNLETVRQGLVALGAERVNSYDPLLGEWQKQLDAASGKAGVSDRSTWSSRMAAAKEPADLEALALELQRAERDARNERDPEFPRGLGNQVAALAAAWANFDPAMLANGNYGNTYETPGNAYSKDIRDLRQRVQREILSRTLNSPELLKAPLAEQPINVALDTLAQNLSNAQEWRRLLTILEVRRGGGMLPNGMPNTMAGQSDAVMAIRSYLAGQNFELAEQWTDAMLSYKAVLSTAAELGPIKDAAARLKALSKDHPNNLPKTDTLAPTLNFPRH